MIIKCFINKLYKKNGKNKLLIFLKKIYEKEI